MWFTDSEYIDYVFGNLNMTEVSSHFLLQRSLSYFNPLQYDGKNNNDTTIRSTSHGMGIYNIFYYAALDTAASYVPSHPSVVSNLAKSFNEQGFIPIVLLNRNYHSIKLDALLNNLFTTNIDSTILYDNPSRTVSPYQRHRIFMAFPHINGSYRSYGDVKFKIAPSVLHFTDTLSNQLEIDFGDGKGYVNVDANATRTVYYGDSGIKTIKVKQGGIESISELNFVKEEVFYQPSEFIIPSEDENLMNRTFSSISQPIVTSFLGCDNVLDKPIIVVEGFAIQPNENANAEDILNTLDLTLLNRLMNLGYDFMVVRFSNNAASIYENAQALRQAINAINIQKIGTNKLNVIGLSMGGLIAKYCLKDMEDSNIDHNVENYFSYDSPHQGAYVPLGLQQLLVDASYAIKDIRNDDQVKFIMSRLNSDAGKQLLQLHQNGIYNSTRSSFASAYAAKGYPTQSNNYGIANGRGDGIGLNYTAGAQLMGFYGSVKAGILGRVLKHTQQLWSINTTHAQVSYLSNKGLAALLGLKGLKRYTSSMSFAGELTHEGVPGSIVGMHTEYGNGLVNNFRSQGSETHDYFGRLFTTFVPTVSALDLNNQNYSQNGRYFSRNPYYDIATNHATVLSNHITPFDDIIYAIDNSQEHLRRDARIGRFIFEKIYGTTMPTGCGSLCITTPTFSGLTNICGNGDATITMANAPSGVIITWVLPSSLEIIEGQGTNVIKVRTNSAGSFNAYVTLTWPGFTSTNYPFTVTYTQPTASISGPSGFCSTTTYTIPNLPAGATVTWNASPAGWVSFNSSGNSVNISPTAYDYGNVTLNAAITTECGVINVTKTIFLGQYPPGDIWGFIGGGDACANSSSNAGITGNYSSYEWTVSGGTILSGQGTSEIRYRVDPYNSASTSFYITCQLRDYCGRSILESPIEYATIVECGPGGGGENTSRLIVYPNPSSEELKIKYPIANDKAEAKPASYTLLKVRLLNEKGRSLKEIEVRLDGKDIILPVANVPNGIYYLHIQEGKKVIKQQVVIAH